MIKRGVDNISSLGFSRDGAFYFMASKQMEDIYKTSLHPETGKIQNPAEKLDLPSEGRNDFPKYSPDGKKLAYLRYGIGSSNPRSTLHIRSLETGKEKVFPLDIRARFPSWSPDGRTILVTGLKDSRLGGIYRINDESGEVDSIMVPQPDAKTGYQGYIGYRYNEWASDGKSFFYVEGGAESSSRIFRYDLETRGKEEIYYVDSMITMALSPDGRWIAFLGRGLDRELTIIPAGGGEPRVVCRFRQKRSAPIDMSRTPDGRYILFFHKKEDVLKQDILKEELFRVPAAGGKMEELGLAVISPYRLAVHPNGRDFLLSGVGFSVPYPEFWVMENFLPENKNKNYIIWPRCWEMVFVWGHTRIR